MSFDVDDSNPNNPLKSQTPQDFGMDSWLDLFILYSDQLDSNFFAAQSSQGKIEHLRRVVQVILAHLVDNLSTTATEGGDILIV